MNISFPAVACNQFYNCSCDYDGILSSCTASLKSRFAVVLIVSFLFNFGLLWLYSRKEWDKLFGLLRIKVFLDFIVITTYIFLTI